MDYKVHLTAMCYAGEVTSFPTRWEQEAAPILLTVERIQFATWALMLKTQWGDSQKLGAS